jgi:hypothetical protein
MIPRHVPQKNEESCDGNRNSRVMFSANIFSKKDFTTTLFKRQVPSP